MHNEIFGNSTDEMNAFTYLFIAALATSALVQLWLANRHRTHVSSHREQVPDAFAERIPLEKINEGFEKMKQGTSARSVIVFD